MKKNKFKYAIAAMLFFITHNNTKVYAQGMAVNTTGTAANSSAILDVSSTSQGVLVPRMLASQRLGISSAATGLLVYQTDGTPGFYYYDGSGWVSLSSSNPTGSAGGDLTGSYPNPTLAGGAVGTSELANSSVTVGKISASGSASSTTYLRGDGTWSTPSGGGGGGASLELAATQTTGQTVGPGGSSTTPITVVYNSTITSPTLGTFNGTTYTAGSAGIYLITASYTAVTNSAVASTIIVNGTPLFYGIGVSNSNFPDPKSRGDVSGVVSLNSGNTISIQASLQASGSTTNTFSTDGTTRLTIVKL